MIEGPSGLKWVGRPDRRPHYEVSRRRLVWPCGAIAYAFSAEDPDSLRGPQFDLAWCDEVGAWARGEVVWDTLAFALRLGERPRIAVTTTPRRTGLIRRLVRLGERGYLVRTQAASRENAAFLSPKFVTELEALYAGTSIAKMELEGKFTDERPGALFVEKMFEDNRVEPQDGLGCERVVVAVDPPASIGPRAAWCGIIAAGLKNEKVYVLQDGSVQNATPLRWAQCVIAVAEAHGAGRVVAESNQGGEMVGQIIRIASDDRHRVDMRHASKSKYARAEPVSAWIGAGRVKFAGVFPELEAEMCAFGESHRSPDRMDALVWAVSELFLERKLPPKVIGF
jgi:phage terminase large subunit-like protein